MRKSLNFFLIELFTEIIQSGVIKVVKITNKIDIDLNEIDPIELSMAFAISKKEIHVIIIGSKNLQHVEENLNYMKKNLDDYKNLINQYENIYEKLDDNWRQLT